MNCFRLIVISTLVLAITCNLVSLPEGAPNVDRAIKDYLFELMYNQDVQDVKIDDTETYFITMKNNEDVFEVRKTNERLGEYVLPIIYVEKKSKIRSECWSMAVIDDENVENGLHLRYARQYFRTAELLWACRNG